jgi:two-component system, NtrC family, response regulator AtoC
MNGLAEAIKITQTELSAGGDQHLSGAGTNKLPEAAEEHHGFIATSPDMRKVHRQVELLADYNVPVLITGECGTGKHAVARLIHRLSRRSKSPFLRVNCAAMPSEILERELFGLEALSQPGKIELCGNGTILLDDITDLPAPLQARLLLSLTEEQSPHPTDSDATPIGIRILASTDVSIARIVRDKRLREDFYYRLSAFCIEVPPLRQRREDIPRLLARFMDRLSSLYSRPPLVFSAKLLEACLQYPWPGNLPELENFVRRYLIMGNEAGLLNTLRQSGAAFVPPGTEKDMAAPSSSSLARGKGSGQGLKSLLRNLKGETEATAISNALEQTQWNRRQAARLLNISYRGMLYKIREYGLQPSLMPVEKSNKASTSPNTPFPSEDTE